MTSAEGPAALDAPRVTAAESGVADPHAKRTLGTLLEQRAMATPHRTFLRMAGVDLTFQEFNQQCNRLAHGLAGKGVAPGDMVAVVLPNCPEFVLLWFALVKLGAIEAAVNVGLRGAGLVRTLAMTGCHVVILDEDQIDALGDVASSLRDVTTVVVRGDAAAAARRFPAWDVLAFGQLVTDRADDPGVPVEVSDTAMVLFTSGTTGPSKGCMLSHRYAVRQGELAAEHLRLQPSDVLYSPYPLFHADAATLTVVPALVLGATAAIGSRFTASGFWEEVRAFEATVFDFMGATLTMLWKRPPQSDDAENPVRLAWGVPMPVWASGFEERFGLKLIEVYGLTDAGVVAFYPYDEDRRPGACGRPVHPYDVRIFDDADDEMGPGEMGEIVVRPLEPSVTMDGYHGMPNETLATFRNLWLHTGDKGYFDSDGYLHFVGRKSDSIRRRGENISAFEIEEVVLTHPDIVEAAAIGVPSEMTEEDVMLCVVPRAGSSVSPEDLVAFCESRMAKFMIPRYVEFRAELPKTETAKVEKYRLQQAGVGPDAWDREGT